MDLNITEFFKKLEMDKFKLEVVPKIILLGEHHDDPEKMVKLGKFLSQYESNGSLKIFFIELEEEKYEDILDKVNIQLAVPTPEIFGAYTQLFDALQKSGVLIYAVDKRDFPVTQRELEENEKIEQDISSMPLGEYKEIVYKSNMAREDFMLKKTLAIISYFLKQNMFDKNDYYIFYMGYLHLDSFYDKFTFFGFKTEKIELK